METNEKSLSIDHDTEKKSLSKIITQLISALPDQVGINKQKQETGYERYISEKAEDCKYILTNLNEFLTDTTAFFKRANLVQTRSADMPSKTQALFHRPSRRILVEEGETDGGDTIPQINIPPEWPYKYHVLRRSIFHHVSIDLKNIQNGYYPRFSQIGEQSDTDGELLRTQYSLIVADALATSALKPLVNAGLLNTGNISRQNNLHESANVRSFTYLSNQVEIRLLPYCDAALIGIPFSAFVKPIPNPKLDNGSIAADISTDYLAIPHEIGHLLYRHGRKGDLSVQQLLQTQLSSRQVALAEKKWLIDWLEELFADAYGCLIAGPLNVIGFQNMLYQSLPSYAFREDSEHPIPEIRPYLQVEMLRAIYNTIEFDPHNFLETRWEKFLNELRNVQDAKTAFYRINAIPFRGQYIIDTATKVIEAIVAVLRDDLKLVPPNLKTVTEIPWQRSISENTETINNNSIEVLANQFVTVRAKVAQQRTKTNSEEEYVSRKFLKEKLGDDLTIDKLVDIIFLNGWSDEIGKTSHAP